MKTWLIIGCFLFPLLGGLSSLVLSNKRYAILGAAMCFISSLALLLDVAVVRWSYEWIAAFPATIFLDPTANLLVALVACVSLMVHLFSLEYLKNDPGIHRYYAKLGFFTTAMIGLLLADGLVLLFAFWELVGLASYLLIGFWYSKSGVAASSRMAFMINRVADVALLIGILLLHDVGIYELSDTNAKWPLVPSLLIVIGAFGKSAQLPFSGWLIKAMAGPTPVSALIHAATMVAAGVYLLVRIYPMLHASVLTVVILVGMTTAFYAGICALFQMDIKRVLAYSTISQLGYMIMSIGVGGKDAAFFHLITHAFFKAGLFLAAGSIIQYMQKNEVKDAQNMQYMGGLKAQLPWTSRAFFVCALSLAGVPFLSGFMSKEGILLALYSWTHTHGGFANLVLVFALITTAVTALYIGRALLLIFWGSNRYELKVGRIAEPLAVKWPLIILALACCWFFYAWNPFSHDSWIMSILGATQVGVQQTSGSMMLLAVAATATGLFLAYRLYGSKAVTEKQLALNRRSFFQEGMQLMAIYGAIGGAVRKVAGWLARLDLQLVDEIINFSAVVLVVVSKVAALVDRFIVDGPVNLVGYTSMYMGKRLAGLSSKDLQTQLAWMLFGLIIILGWILLF